MHALKLLVARLVSVVACMALCVTGLAAAAAVAVGGERLSSQASSSSRPTDVSAEDPNLALGGGGGASASSLSLRDPFGSPAAAGGNSQPIRLTTPPTVGISAAALSHMRLTHLGAAQAASLDREVFPGQVSQRAGGPPSLARGQRFARILSARAAQIVLSHGRRAVVESSQPMWVGSPNHRQPVDLGLTRVGGAFESVRPLVGVLMPRHAGEGVALPEAGVSLTPVNSQGSPLGGSEGTIDGASVVYANTGGGGAMDTVFKPTVDGVQANTVLRTIPGSGGGPTMLYFRLGLPAGARLVQSSPGMGSVRVLEGAHMVGVVLPPNAVDADGSSVPVSMSVLRGDLLAVSVATQSGRHPAPIFVDPEYVTGEDRSLTGAVWPAEPYTGGDCEGSEPAKTCPTTWKPIFTSGFSEATTYKASYSCGSERYWCNQSWYIEPQHAYNGGEFAGLQYQTQGESTIYDLQMWLEGYNEPSQVTTAVEYRYGAHAEGENNHVVLGEGPAQSEYKYEEPNPLSMSSGYYNNPLETPRNNMVRLMDYTTQPESGYGFWTFIWDARVYVAQEESKHPEAAPTSACPQCGFNTTSPTIAEAGNRPNVLYGSGGWLGPAYGAYEVTAHDPGIGVSFVALSGGGMSEERFIQEKLGKCAGIQCPETYTTTMTYLPTMHEGEDQIELLAEDAAGLDGYSLHTIKVDAKAPEKLEVTGWSARREISAAPHTLTLSARDEGPSGTKSSGVKSIGVSVDGGGETVLPSASCAEGPCTATGTYILHAENLNEGVHRLVETATDNSGNIGAKEFTFDVRHASPVAIGPGGVDPTTGQFTLNATDVSLGGVAGVGRTYQSRNLSAGSYGPLGPQWAVNLGASESLVTLPEGQVALTASNGGRTTFAPKGKGEYESPLGDENIKLEAKEEAGTGVSEYLLTDAKAGTTTVFTQPLGTEDTAPIYANQFGQEGAKLGNAVSAASDAAGNVWVTDYSNDRILEFSPTGLLLNSYGWEGTGPLGFRHPWGIAINKTTGNVYVSDPGNNRIEELNSSGGFVRAFGWGVSPGGTSKDEFQDCTEYCEAGIAGSGPGQFNWPVGVAVDSNGDVWVAEDNNDRIQEFNGEGKYLATYGSAGTGDEQFNGPLNIASVGSDLFVTDELNNRVQELTTEGVFVKAIGWGVSTGEEKLQTCTSGCRAGIAGSGKGQFYTPVGVAADQAGNLYVVDYHDDRMQELTSGGAYVTQFGSAGSGSGQLLEPYGVTVSPQGQIYVAEYANKRVQEWMRPTWLPSRTEDTLKHTSTAYAYKPVEEEGKVEIEPTEVLAATPAGITCVGAKGEVEEQYLQKGCRALTFNYAAATTATGEKPAQWGDHAGDLTRVYFHGFDPVSKAMKAKEVAHYLYDSNGRLRTEWDPRKEPKPESGECAKEVLAKGCLATIYGYDKEGHLTSVTPPHQETWALVYGTSTGDANLGRLLKVTRAPVSAKLWTGEAPSKLEGPKLSGTSVVGVRMAVSNGLWLPEPVVYGYQWEDCNSEGKECAAILGATNANYTPTTGDIGYYLEAFVTATNGGGSVVAHSAANLVIGAPTMTYSATIGTSGTTEGSLEGPRDIGRDSSGNLWVAEGCLCGNLSRSRIQVFNSAGEFKFMFDRAEGGTSAGRTAALTIDSHNNVWVANASNGSIEEYNEKGEKQKEFGTTGTGIGQLKEPGDVALDSHGNVWVADTANNRVVEFKEKGEFIAAYGFGVSNGEAKFETCTTACQAGLAGSGSGEFKAPQGITVTTKGNVWVADTGNNRLEEFNEYDEYVRQSGSQGSGNGQFSKPIRLSSDPGGKLWVLDSGNFRIEQLNEQGEYLAQFGAHGEAGNQFLAVSGIALDSAGNAWITEGPEQGKKIKEWTSSTTTSGQSYGAQPGTTIEYGVPLVGSGLQNLTKAEVEKWGQTKDYPAEGTAIFPPDEPQSWPASKYTKATIDYMDEGGRTVNTVSPSGGVSTAEYNEDNEVTRTLSPDSRATAMAEGCVSVAKKECKSAEMAEKLDTRTEYGQGDSQIVKVLGPEHKVKLSGGSEVQARQVTHNFYDEGAQEAEEKNKEEYNLLTKSIVEAETSAGEKFEPRTMTTSYSGQNDLGWKLRKPTSTTVDPSGLDLVSSTVYDENTGNVVETLGAGGSPSGLRVAPVYSGVFGSRGAGSGQFESVGLDAVAQSSGYVWVVDGVGGRVEQFNRRGEYLNVFGSKGSEADQFNAPFGIAVSPVSGNVYVTDRLNYRVDELSSSGSFVRAFGWGVVDGKAELEVCTSATKCRVGLKGSGNGEFGSGEYGSLGGVAVDPNGHVWVVDEGNDRVEEFSETGEYLGQFGRAGNGSGQLSEPVAIAYDDGELYVSDAGNHRVDEFSLNGTSLGSFGSLGSGSGQFKKPYGITADPTSGELYVTDVENNRVEGFSRTGVFIWSFGSTGKGAGQFEVPDGVAVNTNGAVYVGDSDAYNIQEWQRLPGTPLATAQFGSKGAGNGQFVEPRGVAITKTGNVDVLDTSNDRVQEFSPAGAYLAQFGSVGKERGQLSTPYAFTIDSNGNIWVADTGNNRVDEFNEKREFVEAFGFGVINGEEKLQTCTTSCKAGIAGAGTGQLKEPKGIAASGGNIYVADSPNNRVEEFNEKGEFVKTFGYGVSTGTESFQICTSSCRAGVSGAGEGQFNGPRSIAIAQSGVIWVVDQNNNRLEEFNKKSEYLAQFGTKGTGHAQFKEPRGLAIDTNGDLWVADSANNRIQELTPNGTYLTSFADKGTALSQLEEPWGLTVTSTGSIYITDTKNNRITQWTTPPRPGNEGAHDTQTIYYAAGANAEYPACGEHPEWAGLMCRVQTAAQPGNSASPSLPVVVDKVYNIWDELEKSEEKFTQQNAEGKEETVTREKIETYDSAGRAITSEEKATPATDTALPTVTNGYNAETGALEMQSATIKGEVKTITAKENTLGQLVEYTDGMGNVAKYSYEEGANSDGRLLEISEGKGAEAASKQTYKYDKTTGVMTELVDSAAGTFTASYDVEGRMTSEVYPNGMCANTSYNATGTATSISYIKTRNCGEEKPTVWFSDSIVPGIHGETLSQESTLAKEKYTYDNASRLLEATETSAGKDCASRLYSYDEESNRTSETIRESNTETCATEGGPVQGHFYDSANHLIDPGVEYEVFGNTTRLPAVDAGEHEIKSTYYLDNQVNTEEQNKVLNSYIYDPAGRSMETSSENTETKAKATTVSHYAGAGSSPTWASTGAEKWSRSIPGIGGGLQATEESTKVVTLQLTDLQGNIVATASDYESETKLLSTYNSTEFGVPSEGKTPPKYAWLGAGGLATETAFGTGISTQGGTSYVPQVARNLQTTPAIPPGAFPNGMGDGTTYRATIPAGEMASAEAIAKQIYAEAEAARQKARELEAEERERQAALNAAKGSGAASVARTMPTEEQYMQLTRQLMAEDGMASAADILGSIKDVVTFTEEVAADATKDLTGGFKEFYEVGWSLLIEVAERYNMTVYLNPARYDVFESPAVGCYEGAANNGYYELGLLEGSGLEGLEGLVITPEVIYDCLEGALEE